MLKYLGGEVLLQNVTGFKLKHYHGSMKKQGETMQLIELYMIRELFLEENKRRKVSKIEETLKVSEILLRKQDPPRD